MASTISAGTTAGTAIAIAGDTTGNLAFQTNGTTTAMTINTNQSILVGTTNSDVGGSVSGIRMNQTGDVISCIDGSGLLHYQSPVAADRRNTAGDGVMYGMWRAGVYQCGIGATNGSTMTFFTGNNASQTERMRITSGGNLLVGTSSVQNAGNAITCFGGYYSFCLNSGSFNYYFGTDSNNFNVYSGDGVLRGYLGTAGAWTNTSDIAFKKDIVDIKYSLQDALNLRPVSYLTKDYEIPQIGFIAQEMEQVIPEVVSGKEGEKGISYGSLVALCIKAIQELNAKVDAQAAEIAALKGAQ